MGIDCFTCDLDKHLYKKAMKNNLRKVSRFYCNYEASDLNKETNGKLQVWFLSTKSYKKGNMDN